jgi:hypothetical protein
VAAAVFGLLGFVAPALAAAAAGTHDVTQVAFNGPAPMTIPFGPSPLSDLIQFDGESATRAIFMTAIVGMVVAARPFLRSRAACEPAIDDERISLPPCRAALATACATKDEPLVWLNTQTGVWHEFGTQWYGRTRAGVFMSRSEAIEASGRVSPRGALHR